MENEQGEIPNNGHQSRVAPNVGRMAMGLTLRATIDLLARHTAAAAFTAGEFVGFVGESYDNLTQLALGALAGLLSNRISDICAKSESPPNYGYGERPSLFDRTRELGRNIVRYSRSAACGVAGVTTNMVANTMDRDTHTATLVVLPMVIGVGENIYNWWQNRKSTD